MALAASAPSHRLLEISETARCKMFRLTTSTRISAAAPHRGSCACRSSHYDALGVSPDSSDDDIKSAYRQHAKRWHPDINKAVSPISMHACTQSMSSFASSPKQTPIQGLTCVLPGPSLLNPFLTRLGQRPASSASTLHTRRSQTPSRGPCTTWSCAGCVQRVLYGGNPLSGCEGLFPEGMWRTLL